MLLLATLYQFNRYKLSESLDTLILSIKTALTPKRNIFFPFWGRKEAISFLNYEEHLKFIEWPSTISK